MPESLVGQIVIASIGGILTGGGFLIRRLIERKGQETMLDLQERLLRLRKELKEQGITYEQLQEYGDHILKRKLLDAQQLSPPDTTYTVKQSDGGRRIAMAALSFTVLVLAGFEIRSFLKASSAVSRSDVFFISYWTTIMCYALFSLIQSFNEWLYRRK
jgi:hypothetical protein